MYLLCRVVTTLFTYKSHIFLNKCLNQHTIVCIQTDPGVDSYTNNHAHTHTQSYSPDSNI